MFLTDHMLAAGTVPSPLPPASCPARPARGWARLTWICCRMFFSWTRNSFASFALSETPFKAWDSWA